MSNSVRITDIVDEICRRQDHVLEELDLLDQKIDSILRSLAPTPQPVPVPVVSQQEQRAA